MNLHLDKDAFEELIAGASNELAIPANIIEKDYFVTICLKSLSDKLKDMVFKGGTSLTKCYQILDRFSEDIDISYTAASGLPGESRKRQLKKAVILTMEEFNFPIQNIDQTRSRRNYNCYRASYQSIYDPSIILKPELIIETYVALLPFPTTIRMVDNYIYRFLEIIGQLQIAKDYELMPFPITTQSIERTLIDKVFAICDYYIMNKVDKHSRHLYDIHRILQSIGLPETLPNLIADVRRLRAQLPICPSAQPDIDISELLYEIIYHDVYKTDYETITLGLLFVPETYDSVIKGLKIIADSRIFR